MLSDKREMYDPIESIIQAYGEGSPVVIVDDKDREDEGDVVIAAEAITEEQISFMLNEVKGWICLSLSPEILDALAVPLQVIDNASLFGTNFAVSISSQSYPGHLGVTAKARAETIRRAAALDAKPSDFRMPGFVFPLRAAEGGVLQRRGQTEASVDLSRICGKRPAAVICEIMGDDGRMLRGSDLWSYCRERRLPITSVQDILEYRLKNEVFLRRVGECVVDELQHLSQMCSIKFTASSLACKAIQGSLRVLVYQDLVDNKEHLCFVRGEPKDGCLCRIHSECLTGDVFGSSRCDCGAQFCDALRKICEDDQGLVIYLYQEGRGIGLGNKIKAYQLQDSGMDTVEANLELGFAPDMRNYRAGAQILSDLGLRAVRLLTNNPRKVSALEGLGIRVVGRVPIVGEYNEHNLRYLSTKRTRLGHLIPKQLDE